MLTYHPPSVRVDVSVYGRFQAFRLAAELDRLDCLHRLYTSYPRSIPAIQPAHVKNLCWPKAAEVALVRTLGRHIPAERIWSRCGDIYDGYVARRLARTPRMPGRVLHAWASHSLQSLNAAARHGYRTFVDSACPHPSFKKKLLSDEAALMGTRFNGGDDWVERVSAESSLADRIVVPSDYSRRSFVDAGYPARKIVTVPLGVDAEEILPGEPPPTTWTRERPFRVLMIGTEALRKGAFYLLQAWSSLKLTHAELVVRCDVPPSARPLLRHAGVIHLPPMPRAALINLYRSASIFCFPSIDDGFGMVVLEAMAAGLPVITTAHVGASELMSDGVEGFTVPIRDVAAIANRIEVLYRHPDLVRSMGEAARRLACDYPWRRYGASMLSAYQDVCGLSTVEAPSALSA